jgi:hypothetical protein
MSDEQQSPKHVALNYVIEQIRKDTEAMIERKREIKVSKKHMFARGLLSLVKCLGSKIFRLKEQKDNLKAVPPINTPTDILLSLRNYSSEIFLLETRVEYLTSIPNISELDMIFCQKYIEPKSKGALRRGNTGSGSLLAMLMILPAFVLVGKGLLDFDIKILPAVILIASVLVLVVKPFLEDEVSSSISVYEYWLSAIEISVASLKKQLH